MASSAHTTPRNSIHIQLGNRIEEQGTSLVTHAIAAMYTNIFWVERFGERGKRFAMEDGHRHIATLTAALRFSTPGVMANYARWLQHVLTNRGICTRHLDQNFQYLADALYVIGIENPEPAREYLQVARNALRYANHPAGLLQDRAPELANNVVRVLRGRYPEWYSGWNTGTEERCADDVLYHLSYLADALVLDRADVFIQYVSWISDFLTRQRVPTSHLGETLDVLGDHIETHFPQLRVATSSLLHAAHAAVIRDVT